MSLAPLRFAAVLIATGLAMTGLALLPGVLRIAGHEIDLIQTLDIAYRMQDGLIPHLDFLTPLGILAFWPLSWLIGQGYGPGHAFLLSQPLVVAPMLPLIWWVGMSRLAGGLRLAWGIGAVILGLALIFGGAVPSVTTAMYYNRWAWVLAASIVLLIFLPPRPGWRAGVVDGVFLGLAGAALVLLKVTYVIGLAPFALLILLRDGRLGTIGVAALTATAALVTATLPLGGIAFWQAYVGDLLYVAGNSQRPYPGVSLGDLVAGPTYLPMTLLLLGTLVFWRRTGMAREGLALLLLGPGVVYITYQNWGNDPKWLLLLALLLLAATPAADRSYMGWPARGVARALALVAVVLALPSMLNIVASPLRHLGYPAAEFTPLFSDLSRQDIQIRTSLAFEPQANIPLAGIEYPPDRTPEDLPPASVTVNGEPLGDCALRFGIIGWTSKAIAQLGAIEEAVGTHVLVTDIYDHLWLFGPFERNDAMAPWYYGSDQGFDTAEYVLVPFCPVSPGARRTKLQVIEDAGWTLDEIVRSDLFILLRREGSG